MSNSRIFAAANSTCLMRSLVAIALFTPSPLACARQDAGNESPSANLFACVSHDTIALISWRMDAAEQDLQFLYSMLGSGDPDLQMPKRLSQLAVSGVREAACVVSLNNLMGGPANPVRIVIVDRGNFGQSAAGQVLAELVMTGNPDEALVTKPWTGSRNAPEAKSDDLDRRNAIALREQFADAFRQLGDHRIRLAVAIGPDQRRVMAEFLSATLREVSESAPGSPVLPDFDATGFASAIRWVAMGIDSPQASDFEFQLQIGMADEASARALADFAPALCQQLMESLKESLPAALREAKQLSPTFAVAGHTVAIRLLDKNGRDATGRLLSVTEVENDSMSIRQDLRNLVIAFHNYHNAHKHFPAIGSRTDDGQPLLSWRVHILPFIGQHALYDQFHLDEPWDSPHNKSLVEKMPVIFQAAESANAIEQGLANYLLPNGKGAIFRDFENRQFRDITDGTSNTAILLEVSDERAVIWTKPEDWSFDPEHPSAGLGGHIDGRIHFARADGSVAVVSPDDQSLRALITSDAGDLAR